MFISTSKFLKEKLHEPMLFVILFIYVKLHKKSCYCLSLHSRQHPWAISTESCVLIDYPSGIARRDSAQGKYCMERTSEVRNFFLAAIESQNSEKQRKHQTIHIGLLCYKHSSISFRALEINKLFLVLFVSKSFLVLLNLY